MRLLFIRHGEPDYEKDSLTEKGFREAICKYLYQARGVNCNLGQVIVGAGSDYLLMLLCSVIGREHVIAVENPAYKQAYPLRD